MERGLAPDFSLEAKAELEGIKGPAAVAEEPARDMRGLLWCSIDNDDSRDLDQLTVAEIIDGKTVKIFVAIADVDAVVRKGSAIDNHARRNTTSVYTAAEIFPMLPEKLSTDFTSLNSEADRLAVVIEMTVASDGSLKESDIYRAVVRNHAKLAYNSVADWLEGAGPMPAGIGAVRGLEENLLAQDSLAQKMRMLRQEHGALTLETIEARVIFDADELKGLAAEKKNRAKVIIEDFMIAANGVSARYLSSRMFPSLRRVVHTPARWNRIMEIAGESGFELPLEPDPRALDRFLLKSRDADPLRFPDLCLCIIKLLGQGEYVAEFPGESVEGHFGLAVKDYTHSTAPNRRFPDIITQRLLKAALSKRPVPYMKDELMELGKHCTDVENDVRKVERRVFKSAAAMFLTPKIGERFDAIVTGASYKGTWVRIFHPPVEGKLVEGFEGADVGHRVRVELIRTDVERGFIDFRLA